LVTMYKPKTHERSNDTHNELYVALYPMANRNGSWVLYNLTTKAYVCRSQ